MVHVDATAISTPHSQQPRGSSSSAHLLISSLSSASSSSPDHPDSSANAVPLMATLLGNLKRRATDGSRLASRGRRAARTWSHLAQRVHLRSSTASRGPRHNITGSEAHRHGIRRVKMICRVCDNQLQSLGCAELTYYARGGDPIVVDGDGIF